MRKNKLIKLLYNMASCQKVHISKLLAGADNGVNPLGFSFVSNNVLWTSTALIETPHSQFLRTYQKQGEEVFSRNNFEKTSYCQHAYKHLDVVGRYLGANNDKGIINTARNLVKMYEELKSGRRTISNIQVRPVADSDCYQIAGDHFLAAAAANSGMEWLKVNVGMFFGLMEIVNSINPLMFRS
jgi:hypothetical protein